MDGEDGSPRLAVGQWQLEDQVNTAGAQDSRVNQLVAVGRGNDDHAAPALDAIELGEQLADDSIGGAAIQVDASRGRQRVKLVQEEDARRDLLGALKGLPHSALGLADPLR